MRTKVVAVLTLVVVALAPTLIAAEAPALIPVACASSTAPVKVTANVPASAAAAKVYYKAAGQTVEYYSDMRRDADGTMWAFLPIPESGTKSFTYRVVSTNARGAQTSSAILTANVGANCPAQTLSADEQPAASNLIIGLTAPNQSPVPTGFQCRNVVSYISANGELRNHDECRRVLAGLQQPGAPTTAGTGAGTGTTGTAGSTIGGVDKRVVALAALALIGGGIIIRNNNKNENKPVSPSRP